jgi:hypothetical protein
MQTWEKTGLNVQAAQRNKSGQYASWLWWLLAIGLSLRVALFFFHPSIYWADEIFQTQEPAHRLAFGIGAMTWEFRLGARSWVLPFLIAGIMKATAWLHAGCWGYVFSLAVLSSLLSLTAVWFAFVWCRRYFGMRYALLAAFSTTVWFELVHLAPRTLSEVIAGNLFLPAIYLGAVERDQTTRSKWRLFLVGVLLGLTVCLRIQFVPVVLLVGLWILSWEWKTRCAPLCIGAFAVILVFGAVDAFTWSYPFYSYYSYFRENIYHHRAASFGVLPWYYYLGSLFVHTGPLPIFAVIGARRSPILGWACLAVMVPHSFIAHKEFRYIYPVLPILLTLSAVGLLQSMDLLRQETGWRPSTRTALVGAAACVLLCSLLLANRYPRWGKASGALMAFRSLSEDRQACGVAVLQVNWWDTGGYTYLHRPIPVFFYTRSSDVSGLEAFNRVVSSEATPPLRGYTLAECRDGVCIYQRQGGCEMASGSAQYEFSEVLKREQP